MATFNSLTSRAYLSIGEVADLLNVQSWRIGRLFELGLLPEPERVAGRRMIPKSMVPKVIDALRAKGWESRCHMADATSLTVVQDYLKTANGDSCNTIHQLEGDVDDHG